MKIYREICFVLLNFNNKVICGKAIAKKVFWQNNRGRTVCTIRSNSRLTLGKKVLKNKIVNQKLYRMMMNDGAVTDKAFDFRATND